MKFIRPALAWVCVALCVVLAVAWVRGYFVSDLLGYGAPKRGGQMRVAVTGGRGGVAFFVVSDIIYSSEIDGFFWQREGAEYAGDVGRVPAAWKALGFRFVRPSGAPERGWAVVVPLWFLLPLTAAVPVWHYRTGGRRERRRRQRLGLCVRCAYDLRASAEFGRCPECGAPTAERTP